jgi:hypothetical protein
VLVINNAVSDRDLSLILGDLASRRSRPTLWQSNHALWAPELREGFTGTVMITPAHSAITGMLRAQVNRYHPVLSLDRVVCQYCLWGWDSGINPHHDQRYRWAATLYLNDDWCDSFGGVFLTGGHAITPQRGLLVVNEAHEQHCVSRVKPNVPERVTVQIWAW